MSPTIGRIVLYRLNAADADGINRRRDHARANMDTMRAEKPGFQAHVGNPVGLGETVPLIITLIVDRENHSVNGQVLLDGSDSLWVTSVHQGTEPGEWQWPQLVEENPPLAAR